MRIHLGEPARVGSCLGEQGGVGGGGVGGLSVKQGSFPYGGLLTWHNGATPHPSHGP